MSKYTVVRDPRADELIEKDLQLIVASLVELLDPYIQAILLVGGFGRGEGGVTLENGRYRPVNDYDIIVMAKNRKKIPSAVLNGLKSLETSLNRRVHVKQVDIALVNWWQFMIPAPSISRYETKHGHRVLHGKLPFPIQAIPASWIPLYEGTKYFRTRGSGLLIARLLLDGWGNFSQSQRLEMAFLEINKALLVLGDSFLIRRRRYHYSYVKRRELWKKLSLEISQEEIYRLYLQAIDQKLLLNLEGITFDTLDKLWYTAAELLLESFLEFEGNRLRKQFSSLEDYWQFIQQKWVRKSPHISRLRELFPGEDNPFLVRFRLASMFLLLHRLQERFSTEEKNRFIEVFPEISDNLTNLSWESVAISFLHLWHPGGIVAELSQPVGATRA